MKRIVAETYHENSVRYLNNFKVKQCVGPSRRTSFMRFVDLTRCYKVSADLDFSVTMETFTLFENISLRGVSGSEEAKSVCRYNETRFEIAPP